MLACGIAAAIFLLPVISLLHGMARYFVHVLTHQGDYGRGGAARRPCPTCWQIWARFGIPCRK